MAAKRAKSIFPRSGHDHESCVADALETAERLCAAADEQLTPLRRRVLELVWDSHRPVGAYALLDRLREDGRGAAPPTVYRTLDFLLARGLIHRIESLNAFVGCSHPGADHPVQFLICKQCGAAAELEDPNLGEALERRAAAQGFSIESRVIELSGECAACQAASKPAKRAGVAKVAAR